MQSGRVRLDGWKEISAGLGVSERTARRYENQECLPVLRHIHEKRGSVYAWSDELESWKQARSAGLGASLLTHVAGAHSGAPQERNGSDAAATINAGSRQGHATHWLPLVGREHECEAVLKAVDAAR